MRSLVYAKNFNEVIFISKSNEQKFLKYPLLTIKNEDEFFVHVENLKPKNVVVDNYDFTHKHEQKFKKLFPHIKLSVFDDDYREHFCDEIINHNISADKNRYKNPDIVKIIPPLIREEFHKEKSIKREKIYDIFISMGGTDSTNINIPILKTLSNSLHISIVTTNANQNLEELKKYVNYKKNISLHIDSKNIAKLLNQSRFAIITPSVIIHEVLFMKVPFLAIKTASNQDDIYKYLKKNRYKVLENFDKNELLKCL